MSVRIVSAALAMVTALGLSDPDRLAAQGAAAGIEASPAEMVDFRDFESLRTVFERHRGDVRLVALLAPTCGYCIKGYRYMRRILEEIQDPRLKMIVVWESMLSGDSRAMAAKQAGRGADPRIVYQAWDPANLTGQAWAGAMGIGSPAWDVYFLYGADASWTPDAPTKPAYWQHQGAGERENWLDYGELKARIEQLLEQAS